MEDVPFDQLPHDDYGAWLLGTLWGLWTAAGILMSLRLYCKITRRRGLWADDFIMIAAWLALMMVAIFTSVDVSYDFGKHNWDITPGNWSWLLLYANLGGSFSIIAAAWSKTSFALTLLRIVTECWMKRLVWFIILSINIALGLNVLFTWIQCWPVEKTWRTASTPGTCWPKRVPVDYNIFTASFSGAMDIVLAVLPWKIIWGLSMNKKEKIGVSVAMSMGLFAGAVSFVKIKTIAAIGAFDIIDTVELVIWGAAESAVTIMAASIPILRALFRDYKPPQARFDTDEESMMRRLGAPPVCGNAAKAAAAAAATKRGTDRTGSVVSTVDTTRKSVGSQDTGRENDLELPSWSRAGGGRGGGGSIRCGCGRTVGRGVMLSSYFDPSWEDDDYPSRKSDVRDFSRRVS